MKKNERNNKNNENKTYLEDNINHSSDEDNTESDSDENKSENNENTHKTVTVNIIKHNQYIYIFLNFFLYRQNVKKEKRKDHTTK